MRSVKMRSGWIIGLSLLCALPACKDDAEQLRDCPVGRTSELFQTNETLCDGIDNDCDGLTDVLVPGVHNACETTATGQCGAGVASCEDGVRVCMTPPAVDETWDGKDNDCDGQTDEEVAADSPLPAMACIAAPPYLWDESQGQPRPVVALRHLLHQSGIPFNAEDAVVPAVKPDWKTTLADLDLCRMLIIPGYVKPALIDVSDGDLKRLEDWVKQGGVLIWTKPLGPDGDAHPTLQAKQQQVLGLGGAVSHKQIPFAETVRLTGKGAATLWLNHGPERNVKLTDDPHNPMKQKEVFTYKLAPGTEVLAEAMRGETNLGPVWLRRKLGQGAVYTLGFDPTDYAPQRCYVNCFDPGFDIAVMFLKGAWREAGHGHYVVKHTVPGVERGVLLSSHDVDAPDANYPGEWGDAGVVRMAEMEKQEGVVGTYFITTDYVAKYYNAAVVKRLCQLGRCPEGGHSIQHLYWNHFPMGTCKETQSSYVPSAPTVCGEVGVCFELLRRTIPSGTRLDAWRTPYLEINPKQYEVLAKNGVIFDSSLASGDVRSNLPIDLPRFSYYDIEDTSKIPEMWVFPVNIEDGIGWYEDGVEQRREVSPMWLSEFKHRWAEQLEGNGANGAWNVLLIHPSMGVGKNVGPSNLQVKIDATRWVIRYAKKIGLHVDSITRLGDFWRARHHTRLKTIVYKDGVYTGRIVIGKLAARRFSLEFGDRIKTFKHSTSSPVQIAGRRVAFDLILPPGAEIAFTATVDKSGK